MSWDKFNETRLPPKEAFYSNLNMSDISDKDYSYTQKVWKGLVQSLTHIPVGIS